MGLQVLQANEEAFNRVTHHLQTLSWLLPGYAVTLAKREGHVSNGVEFRFARSHAELVGTAGDDDDSMADDTVQWSADTAQLSGGQRTLLCLAFMVAVSMQLHAVRWCQHLVTEMYSLWSCYLPAYIMKALLLPTVMCVRDKPLNEVGSGNV